MYTTVKVCYGCDSREVTATFETSEQALKFASENSSGCTALCNKAVSYFGLCEKCKGGDFLVHVNCMYCGDLVDTKYFLTEEDALKEYPDATFKKTKATTKEAFVFAGDCTFCKPTN